MTPFHACLLMLVLTAHNSMAQDSARDSIDHLRSQVPPGAVHPHGYSDFTDPLGRFLDLLGAGAFEDARSIQPAACDAWDATRKTSAFSGKFTIWDTQTDLDTICAGKQRP